MADLNKRLTPILQKEEPLVTLKQLAHVLRSVDDYTEDPIIKTYLQLVPLTLARLDDLQDAQWNEIDFENQEWNLTINKSNKAHSIPLSSQAITLLEKLHLLTGDREGLFPTKNSKRYIDRIKINCVFDKINKSINIKMILNDFRRVAVDILNAKLKYDLELIQYQLNQILPMPSYIIFFNPNGYMLKFNKESRLMMQHWADHLDELKTNKIH